MNAPIHQSPDVMLVHDSMFGSTPDIAEASAVGLPGSAPTVDVTALHGREPASGGCDADIAGASTGVPEPGPASRRREAPERPEDPAPTPRDERRRPSPDTPAEEVLVRYIERQAAQIVASDPLVRLDAPQSVHAMRVVARRLRSCLQTFKKVLRRDEIRPICEELKWLAGVLGAARDAEVMRDRIAGIVSSEAPQFGIGAGDSSVDPELAAAYRSAHRELLEALDSPRYRTLLRDLQRLVTEPPLSDNAARPASRVLSPQALRAFARLDALVTTASEARMPAERDSALHEARKAAKKARYAGETLAEFFGRPAARFVMAMEELQTELGELQDSVVTRRRLEEIARDTTSPAAAFLYGRLHAHEERAGELAVSRFEHSWRTAEKKSLLEWMA
ncbi:CHAD domain-containing protein [Microbacterium sp. SS28]|uniref:CHAD domain-containing protein n=1 Tax=Microbacterium sp. SS28 TaxID=2919948 RepID=UPI001FAAC647|nr:CHAD domain-containing protein [Microbacterium sp. SS28]